MAFLLLVGSGGAFAAGVNAHDSRDPRNRFGPARILRLRELDKDAGTFQRFERRFGTFSRTIGLPAGVSEDAINASYVNGVLEISVPKPEQPKPKRIEVAVPGEQPVIQADSTS
jgi:hypothetical protein